MDPLGKIKACGISHAHVHIVPGTFNLDKLVSSLNFEKISNPLKLKRYSSSGYVLVKHCDTIYASSDANIESQYLRKYVSKEVGYPDKWDWKENLGREQVFTTLNTYSHELMHAIPCEYDKEYAAKFISLAETMSKKATCNIRKVGAVLVAQGKQISSGWNSSPDGLSTCEEAGHIWQNGHCIRTLHAEAMCFANAGRTGVSINSSDLFVTAFPCYSCFKLAAVSGVKRIFFHSYTIDLLVLQAARELGIQLILIDK
jgi:dCMP deaminase